MTSGAKIMTSSNGMQNTIVRNLIGNYYRAAKKYLRPKILRAMYFFLLIQHDHAMTSDDHFVFGRRCVFWFIYLSIASGGPCRALCLRCLGLRRPSGGLLRRAILQLSAGPTPLLGVTWVHASQSASITWVNDCCVTPPNRVNICATKKIQKWIQTSR